MEKESKVCCMSMIPSGYSIRERVEPIEKNDVIGYDDMQGNSYVGIKPDFEKEGWVNDLIEQVGLEELCKEFPYVHLKVDKKTRLLVPVDGKSQYAKITNLFHILYHMRKDEELKKQQQQQTVVQPVFVPQYSQNNGNPFMSGFIDMVSRCIQEYAFSMDFEKSDDQIPSIAPEWEKAYHREEEPVVFHKTSPAEAFLETEEDIKNKYALKNVDANMLPEGGLENVNAQKWHPNQNRYVSQNPFQQSGINPSMAYPNPYVYNPNYGNPMMGMQSSYLPQYKSQMNPSWPQIDTQFPGVFGDANARMADDLSRSSTEAASINQQARANNPSMLEPTTIDFSNPESVANMMVRSGQFANPMVNNMANPNISYGPTTPQPYGLNNPYRSIYNSGYGGYTPMGYGYYNGGFSDLSFMEPTEEDLKEKKTARANVVRGEVREEKKQTIQKKPKSIKVTVVREYVSEEEPKQNPSNEKKEERENKWFSEEYEKKVNKLADEIAIYDEARALCLVGSLEDLNRNDFKIYFNLTLEKLKWYRAQEQIHPDIDYRVPFRYRELPKKLPDKETGKMVYISYKAPFKKTFMFKGKPIPFYDFDRGCDPSDEEWTEFYRQAEYERDMELAAAKAEAAKKYFEEQDQQDTYNPWDPMSVRMYEYRQQQKRQQQQYDIFRTALGGRVTDEEFDKWWYGNTTSMRNGNPTQQDIAETKRRWRDQMYMNHMYKLNTATPVDPAVVSDRFTAGVNAAIRDFDHGVMDNCNNVKDFFDNLGYLNVRISEQNIEKQRRESMDQTISRSAYENSLHRFVNTERPGYPIERFLGGGSGYQQLNPSYGMPPNYIDFRSSAHYEQAKRDFMNYCATSTGTVPLKPIYD